MFRKLFRVTYKVQLKYTDKVRKKEREKDRMDVRLGKLMQLWPRQWMYKCTDRKTGKHREAHSRRAEPNRLS
jgi:hypothetical protein